MRGLSVAVQQSLASDVLRRQVRRKLTRIALERDSLERGQNVLDLRTQELGGRPERVTVLPELALILGNVDLVLVLGGELRVIEQAANVLRHLNLAGVRAADVVDKLSSARSLKYYEILDVDLKIREFGQSKACNVPAGASPDGSTRGALRKLLMMLIKESRECISV